MTLQEKLAILGAKERAWLDDETGQVKWLARVTLALKLIVKADDDQAKVLGAKERIAKALAKSMFVRAVLAGHSYGVMPEIRDEILRDKDRLLSVMGITVKREGEETGDIADLDKEKL